MNNKKIGKAISERMKELDYSKEKLASELTISVDKLDMMLDGGKNISNELLLLTAIVLDMNINDLLDTKSNKKILKELLTKKVKSQKLNWLINLIGGIIVCVILCIIDALFMVNEVPSKVGVVTLILVAIVAIVADVCNYLTNK